MANITGAVIAPAESREHTTLADFALGTFKVAELAIGASNTEFSFIVTDEWS